MSSSKDLTHRTMLSLHLFWDKREREWRLSLVPSHVQTQNHISTHFVCSLNLVKHQFVPLYFLTLQQYARVKHKLSHFCSHVFALQCTYFSSDTNILPSNIKTLMSITAHSQKQPSNYPHSPPLILPYFPPPNPLSIHPFSVPIGKQVNTYSSQLPLKTTDTCWGSRAVYVVFSCSPLPSFLRLLSQNSESKTGTKIADRPEFLQQTETGFCVCCFFFNDSHNKNSSYTRAEYV